MAAKPTLHGRELSDAELEAIRAQVESFDRIEHIDDEMRDLIAQRWPHLLDKLPLRMRPRRKPGTRPRRPG
jgi:imidazolonepropionase-like amidohydrolase